MAYFAADDRMAVNGIGYWKLFLVAPATGILSGCSGDVAGNVFVKMDSGDVRRGRMLRLSL